MTRQYFHGATLSASDVLVAITNLRTLLWAKANLKPLRAPSVRRVLLSERLRIDGEETAAADPQLHRLQQLLLRQIICALCRCSPPGYSAYHLPHEHVAVLVLMVRIIADNAA